MPRTAIKLANKATVTTDDNLPDCFIADYDQIRVTGRYHEGFAVPGDERAWSSAKDSEISINTNQIVAVVVKGPNVA